MTIKRRMLNLATAIALAGFTNSVHAQEPIPVVTTFSILGDMVERIGGDAITVTTLVGRNGDSHVYQPTPADAKAVKRASLLFTNGLEFEGWLERLAEAAEFNGETVVSTDGLELISMEEEHHDDEEHHDEDEEHAEGKEEHHDEDGDAENSDAEHDADGHEEDEHGEDEHGHHDHGEFDPHGWLSLQNAVVYVDNITAALAKTAPANATTFYQNRADYVAEIEQLDTQIKAQFAALPESARTVVTSHDAFQYFARDYGLTFLAPQGLSTESEASARDVAELIKQIRTEGISAVFVENVADPRLLQQIARETGSVIGGKLFPGALSGKDGPAATYLELMRHNATTITAALTEAKK